MRIREEEDRHLNEGDADEDEHGPLPASEASRGHDGYQRHRGGGNGEILGDSGVRGGEGDTDELSDDGQEVEDEQVTNAEPAPCSAEPFVDEFGVTDAGNGPQSDHHLLIHNEDRDEQQQGPQQAGVVVLTGLSVGGHTAGVVVPDHDDEGRTRDGGEGEQPSPPTVPFTDVTDPDPPEGTLDIAQVGFVEDGSCRRLKLRARSVVGAWRIVRPGGTRGGWSLRHGYPCCSG